MKYTTEDLHRLGRNFVGFDKIVESLKDIDALYGAASFQAYPPYNLKKIDDTQYVIEVAVAGFSKNDISLSVADGKLVITGELSEPDEGQNYLHRGIANRNFNRTFTLADTVNIGKAELVDGLLKVFLEVVIPEHKKPRTINIT